MQLLLELLDSQVKLHYVQKTSTLWKATAEVNGRKITYNAILSSSPFDGPDHVDHSWRVNFNELLVLNNARVPTRIPTYQLTGSGGEKQVLAGMKQFIQDLYQEQKFTELTFSSEDDSKSRTKVYLHMIKRWLGSDWEINVEDGRGNSKEVKVRKK